jgi:hypothetical protein
MRSITNLLLAIALILLLGGAWYLGSRFDLPGIQKEEHQKVLLEKVKTVAKLVTVEGYFSEVYDYKDYLHFDIFPLRKKALVRVKAKVSIGYDLEKLKIEAIADQHLIRISQIPEPEIISLEHDLDYYDLTEGVFNNFTEGDYNRLNKNAKNFIRNVALESDLAQIARDKKNGLLEIMEFMVENSGWQLIIEDSTQGMEQLKH